MKNKRYCPQCYYVLYESDLEDNYYYCRRDCCRGFKEEDTLSREEALKKRQKKN